MEFIIIYIWCCGNIPNAYSTRQRISSYVHDVCVVTKLIKLNGKGMYFY